MIKDNAARLQQPRDCAEIERQVGDADMLVHTDRDDLVEDRFAGDIAIILAAHLHSAGQPGVSDSPSGFIDLRLAEGDADGGDAVVRRRPADQPTPAAANVEQPIAGLEPQLAADMIKLLLLCGVEIFAAGLKVSAGIYHVSVEPETVELVRDVVMESHIGRISCLGAAPAAPRKKGRDPAKQRRFSDLLGDCDANLQHILRLTIDSELAGDVSRT